MSVCVCVCVCVSVSVCVYVSVCVCTPLTYAVMSVNLPPQLWKRQTASQTASHRTKASWNIEAVEPGNQEGPG